MKRADYIPLRDVVGDCYFQLGRGPPAAGDSDKNQAF